MAREVQELSIFTRELFSTPHDATVLRLPLADALDLGIALRADRKVVVDKLRPHP